MTLHHRDPWIDIHGGDCRDVLASLPDESVHCVVTSPPYWGLRDYGTASWEGGDAGCDHLPDAATLERQNGRASTLVGTTTTQKQAAMARHRCKCGAVRQDRQLGLEPTPEEYVANMVAVFREVRRVLRDDGTLWLNLGDSYAHSGRGEGGSGIHSTKQTTSRGSYFDGRALDRRTVTDSGLKPKDLVGIPWRVAFALQADGWYLRSDIIWAKPNPMPESVTDRPTKAHEYLFLLTKSARYHYDADAIKEPTRGTNDHDLTGPGYTAPGQTPQTGSHMGASVPWEDTGTGRNRRSVWTIATQPYPGAHFAVMPEALVEPCILAGCPEGGTVLDPFGGSGTVARVANRLSRRAVLIDLNPDYLEQQMQRNAQIPMGLTAA